LLRYCELDTLAMVEIYRKLFDLCKWLFIAIKLIHSILTYAWLEWYANFHWVIISDLL